MRYRTLKSEIYGNPSQMISLYRDGRGDTYEMDLEEIGPHLINQVI